MIPEPKPEPTQAGLILEKYHKATSEKERALLEQALWQTLSADVRKRMNRRAWLASLTGETEFAVENRLFIFGELEATDLWDRIEKDKMPLTTARERLREAKALVDTQGLSLKDAIAARLKEYDTWPTHTTKKGQPFRKKPSSRFADLSEVVDPSKVVRLSETDRGFWSRMRHQLAQFAASRFKGADPIIAERLYREFERDLKVLFDEFQSRLSRLRQREKRDRMATATVKYSQVRDACVALCMDPPSRGKPADLDLARSKKKKLARVYHPDVTGGDEGTRAKYEETLAAYSVLEDYNDQLKHVEDL